VNRNPYSPIVPIFRADEEARVRELLAAAERPVELVLALGPEEAPLPGAREIDFAAEAEKLLRALAALSERLTVRVTDAPELPVERFPAICVLPDGEDVGIRYYGLPWGYELGSLVGVCVEAGRRASSLAPESLATLGRLDGDRSIDVFVTPT
jgi:alkyl hydroperoxide reductase subunit AhpF